jgi:hypothetical protein
MTKMRGDHTATLLPDGEVLIAGNSPLPPSDADGIAELYHSPPFVPVTFDPGTVTLGGSFVARFSGTNLTASTYFDIRFLPPGSSVDEVAYNWQQGTSSAHTIATSLAAGTWTVTGVRAHQNLADHSGDFFPVSVTLTVVLRSRASATTEYYASPKGGGSGLSEQDPFQIADAWSVIRPGDTLWLLDGVYTGDNSMIRPPAGVAGTADARIAIRARKDGQVLIDGQGSQNRVVLLDYINGNNYFEIEGINATGGLNYVIDSSATGNIFRRCIAWNARSDEGEQTWRSNGPTTDSWRTALRLVAAMRWGAIRWAMTRRQIP